MATIIPDPKAKAQFHPDRFQPLPVAETPRGRFLLVGLEAGQTIPAHCPGVDMALVILDGRGVVTAGSEEHEVGPGAVAVVPAGERRGLRALTRLVAFHAVTPPPTEADHAEVVAGLRRAASARGP